MIEGNEVCIERRLQVVVCRYTCPWHQFPGQQTLECPVFFVPVLMRETGRMTRPAYLSQKSLDISACMVRFGPC